MYEVPLPFDPIWHCPTEEFHLLKEGLTKMMVKRLFETRSTKESREVFQTWSTLYQGMCVFSETPRYTRNISTSKMKGCELGIIMYSAFPSLVELMVNRKDDFW